MSRPVAQGMRADIVTLELDHPALAGKSGDALLDGWLFAAGRSPVASVYAAGRRHVGNGRRVDARQIGARFKQVMQRLPATV